MGRPGRSRVGRKNKENGIGDYWGVGGGGVAENGDVEVEVEDESGGVEVEVEDGGGSYQNANEYPEDWYEQGEEAEKDDLEKLRR